MSLASASFENVPTNNLAAGILEMIAFCLVCFESKSNFVDGNNLTFKINCYCNTAKIG